MHVCVPANFHHISNAILFVSSVQRVCVYVCVFTRLCMSTFILEWLDSSHTFQLEEEVYVNVITRAHTRIRYVYTTYLMPTFMHAYVHVAHTQLTSV